VIIIKNSSKIQRLQNPRLYRAYSRFKETVESTNRNEKYLFHGTSEENIESICKYGFKRDLCGKNGLGYLFEYFDLKFNLKFKNKKGVALGHGVYFALYSRYSDKFNEVLPSSPGDMHINKKRMFRVRVVLGESCLGDPTYKQPPNGYHSCTDATKTLYACYNDSQFYPEYILTYFT
jgi:hypothetical protein